MISSLFVRQVCLKKNAYRNDEYVFSLPVVKNIDKLIFEKNITFLVGENGTGKSTLLEAVAVNCGFNAEGGSRNFNFSTSDTHSPLADHITVVKGASRPRDGFFLRAESFYNVASNVEELAASGISGTEAPAFYDNFGGRSLHRQSHGESFTALMQSRFRGQGLYLLDEPEAALSPTRQMSLITRLHHLAKEGSQFIIATHSPILMAMPEADIYVLDEKGVRQTPYEQTEHYQITKQFLMDPQRMLDILYEDMP